MAFLVGRVYQIIRDALGGAPSSEQSLIGIVNDAGERLVNMHGWGYLVRPPALLNVVAGQSFITLPADFNKHIALDYTSQNTYARLCTTTMAQVQALRTGSSSPSSSSPFFLHYCYGWFTDTDGVPKLRLEIAPVPTESAVGVLTIWYRTGWLDRSKEIEPMPLPPFMRPLYTEIVQAVALGFQNVDTEPTDKRISQIRSGSTFADAVAMDRTLQADPGIPGVPYGTAAWWGAIDWAGFPVLPPS